MKCDIAKGPKRMPIAIEYRNTTSEEKKVRFPLLFSEKSTLIFGRNANCVHL